MTQDVLAGPLGLIVEGPCERDAIPALLEPRGIRFARPASLNGQMTGSDLSSFVTKQVVPVAQALLAAKSVRALFVVFDREKRAESAAEIEAVAEVILRAEIGHNPPIYVAVADCTFENWLLTDPKHINRHSLVRKPVPTYASVDGKDALALLKGAIWPLGYVKTRHGPALAAVVDTADSAVTNRSASLKRFVNRV